ncbi:SDR family NAD(P)-dependent oxidoreductase [Oceanibium sediminis]|uniref:SDR family NAD(P)-dependent oxidoreductase n=1 Tax=Oceanibium sediminis TaxID=2026339 RepID=UPI00130039D8|nr:SDR family oxidoreductase [Oceanibium sediminis]
MMKADPHTPSPPCAVVTGAASGIGREVAVSLLRDGWQVIGVDRAGARHDADRYTHLIADLGTGQGIRDAIDGLKGRQLKAFVHSAGIMRSDDALAEGMGEDLWALHVVAPQRLAAALLPDMPDTEGRIVLISSRAAQGRAGRGLYSASKAGGEALVRSLALAALRRGITVNAVAPGPVATAQSTDPARRDAPVAPTPQGRMIAPGEIAATVRFLLSRAAGAITGQTIVQCAGLSLVPPDPNFGGEDTRSWDGLTETR